MKNNKLSLFLSRALAYEKAMEQLSHQYSDDREAAAFYVLAAIFARLSIERGLWSEPALPSRAPAAILLRRCEARHGNSRGCYSFTGTRGLAHVAEGRRNRLVGRGA